MKYYNIDENFACTAHKLVTYADWEAAGSFEKAASPGDYVEERIIDQMRDCLPPACMNFGFLQMGEPCSHELDPDTGKWKPTFATFKKDGQQWTYCGNCFYKQDTPPRSEMHHGIMRSCEYKHKTLDACPRLVCGFAEV